MKPKAETQKSVNPVKPVEKMNKLASNPQPITINRIN
jgi:hypothetical protein